MIQNQKNIILIVILILTSPFFLGACDKKLLLPRQLPAKLLRRLLHRVLTQKGLKQWKK